MGQLRQVFFCSPIDIDLDEDYWRMLDIRIAGIHSLCWQGGSKEENTQGVINAMRNPQRFYGNTGLL